MNNAEQHSKASDTRLSPSFVGALGALGMMQCSSEEEELAFEQAKHDLVSSLGDMERKLLAEDTDTRRLGFYNRSLQVIAQHQSMYKEPTEQHEAEAEYFEYITLLANRIGARIHDVVRDV